MTITGMKYKTIKLKSGELLACGIETDFDLNNTSVLIYRPIQFSSFKFMNQRGQVVESITLTPFLVTSNDEIMEISTDSIMTVCDLTPTALSRYKQFVDIVDETGSAETVMQVDFGDSITEPHPEFESVDDVRSQLDDVIEDILNAIPKDSSKLH